MIWLEWKHSHVPMVEEIRNALKGVPADEKRKILARAKLISSYAKVLEEALGSAG